MKVKLWGTRGSLATPGKNSARYGGNTSCVEVRSADGSLLLLDAGTGIRLLGESLGQDILKINLLLTHLHMDHIQGLGFFPPLFNPNCEVNIWGPPSTTKDLADRLTTYLSPPLFPVCLRDLSCKLKVNNLPLGDFEIGPFQIKAALICHPGPTVGFRITEGGHSIAYLPDHEPFLGCLKIPDLPEWTSGYELAEGVDILFHDTQYTNEEYRNRVGWGHCSIEHAIAFARLTKVKRLVFFHHDPMHQDEAMDSMIKSAQQTNLPFIVEGAMEGATYQL